MVLVGAGLARASGAGPVSRLRSWALPVAAAVFALAMAAYVADLAVHPGRLLAWYDLNVYNHAGLIARNFPARLYTWQLKPGIKFTYTPFAALVFALGSLLPWAVLKWLMTAVSLAAVPAIAWLTLGGLGRRGRDRAVLTLAVAAVALWTEPVLRALHLGQIELLLTALIAWDLCQSDGRWWKGAGVGVAAGIKLVPLIFIPYLVLAGKLRQALVASAAFAASAVIGFVFLPHASSKWWLTGYFLHAGNVGDVGSLLNQSLYAMLTRLAGGARAATPVWLGISVVVGIVGLAAAALLHRRGRPVAGWVTCALTGLLVSPISWDHHWVWIVPVLALLADAAARARGAARWAYLALAGAVVAVYGGWPYRWTGRLAFVPHGLLGFFIGPHPQHLKYDLRGLQLISWNLFVLGGLVMFGFAAGAAARAWLGRPGGAGAEPGEQ
ncbi:MAG TPA: glycosyltransferase 87 family protein [Streptosporangiaceae bacterium]|jgi:alpha-1,2-mannosyltransferase|nr:glycosyltransferase 87 family protein [Streptosporangiaceae bacterium]